MRAFDALCPDPLYPEKESERHANKLEAWGTAALRWLSRKRRQPLWRTRRILAQVRRETETLGDIDLAGVRRRADEIAFDLRANGINAESAARAFALIRQAGRLALGKAHFDVQLLGGWAMLQGMVAEMNTGEGKTLTATLPAATVAMAGLPVHVITTNDYLVERDAQIMGPLYEALGLSVAWVSMEMDIPTRRKAYQADVVYCSNKTLVFDYLRDLIVLDSDKDEDALRLERLRGAQGRLGQLYLRGLCFAIVDEADSVLVDEARTPLIISGVQEDDTAAVTRQAMELAGGMAPGHYRLHRGERRVTLTELGREHLGGACAALAAPWSIPFRREELVLSALTVLHLYRLDEQYIIRDGKIMVVDEFTGRVMPDRSWGQGLHQMLEHKEGLELSEPRATLKSISYQRFFKHYLLLSGMTGTAAEIRAELGRVYDLPVVRIPTHRKSRRRHAPDAVYPTLDEKWAAVRDRTRVLHQQGVPILIGTRSVAASEQVARVLAQAGLPAVVLNAKQDADEADMIARAGEPGSIMIATNMAGRGTDIPLSDAARAAGGLHVILTERHESARIDRQLEGRSGRQGDPGHVEAILSLEDSVLDSVASGVWAAPLRLLRARRRDSSRLAARWLRFAQARTERKLARERRQMVAADEELENSLSFSGQGD
ncbi:protein translocase subunit SecA 2 [Achromobacter xylosoxidans A8]|uniref:Protein translocase subunit SecA n=1 Tax=Achromobacter xylosoxidans (strain A8) TaxID=762376 RepID=E3HMK6_ACHXA|nr:preprotein translocase subunit SecA [Achromobacter xylosoxidans]ADP18233.1 protein translocase subunit SecA 2 [Achromobacter xylosoxidans A8]